MVQLLHKLKIRASDGPDILMKVVKNPVTNHFPPNCVKIGTSVKGELVDMRKFVTQLPVNETIVFTVGSQAHGDAITEWTQQTVAVSQYPLSDSISMSL